MNVPKILLVPGYIYGMPVNVFFRLIIALYLHVHNLPAISITCQLPECCSSLLSCGTHPLLVHLTRFQWCSTVRHEVLVGVWLMGLLCFALLYSEIVDTHVRTA